MIHFDSPVLLALSLAIVAATVAGAAIRRIRLRPTTRALMGAGLVLLSLAAGGATVELRRAGRVAVLIDTSASTRTADYRSPENLRARVAALLDSAPHELREFSPNVDLSFPAGFDAVLLFSDGRFEAPALAPPTYAVIDRALAAAGDARVEGLEVRGSVVAATIVNHGDARELALGDATKTVAASQVVVQPSDGTAGPLVARLNAADAWPENDALTIYPPPGERRERWWVGTSAPSHEWIAVEPSSLPIDPAKYLNVALIVLDNVPADALSAAQQQRLLQYVRDLGGGAIVLGGGRAFAAGGYPGTPLETISPLSSTPPRPTTHWVVLVDSSGSMAAPAGGATRFRLAADAAVRVVDRLPPDDPVSLGSFARDVRWWSQGRPARELVQTIPPADVVPRGPTNLQPALESIVAGAGAGTGGTSPTEVLVLSDADAKLDPSALTSAMRSKRVRVHLLATAEVDADNVVKQLVESTGGTMLTQIDPQRWATSLRELMRAASPAPLRNEPLDVRFVGPLSAMRSRTVQPSNHVWPKERATPIATAASVAGSATLAAMWNIGAGRVAAIAFAPSADEVEALAPHVASPPRDPRFVVSWQAGRVVRVTIDAIDGGRFMNGLSLTLRLVDPSDAAREDESKPIPQVGPGRYELEFPAPATTRLASVMFNDRAIAQQAIAGRYAPEFDAIGTDRAALRALAERTGGRVVEPTDTGPINFNWTRRRHDATAVLATAGALLVALGLVHWKLR